MATAWLSILSPRVHRCFWSRGRLQIKPSGPVDENDGCQDLTRLVARWSYVHNLPDNLSLRQEKLSRLVRHPSSMWLANLEIGAEQLCSLTEFTEIRNHSSYVSEQKHLIRYYGLRAGSKRVRYSVKIAWVRVTLFFKSEKIKFWIEKWRHVSFVLRCILL